MAKRDYSLLRNDGGTLECKESTLEDMEPETEYIEKMGVRIADINDGRKERTTCQEATNSNPD
jgi:hypothetical protein